MCRRSLIVAVLLGCLAWPAVASAQRATRGLHADALRTTLELLPDHFYPVAIAEGIK